MNKKIQYLSFPFLGLLIKVLKINIHFRTINWIQRVYKLSNRSKNSKLNSRKNKKIEQILLLKSNRYMNLTFKDKTKMSTIKRNWSLMNKKNK